MVETIQQITEELRKQIEVFEPEYQLKDIGTVVEAGDGIARVKGLSNIRSQELVEFENGVVGIAFNLEKDNVGILSWGNILALKKGCKCAQRGGSPLFLLETA